MQGGNAATHLNPIYQNWSQELLHNRELLDFVKEISCYVALNLGDEDKGTGEKGLAERTRSCEKMVRLYDRRLQLKLNDERFKAPEILFKVGNF